VGVWISFIACLEEKILTYYFMMMQAVLVASDCNPLWLTKHLQSLAASRGVPLIFVKDNKQGSLRLGELVKLKTAIAIGIKVRSYPHTRFIFCLFFNCFLFKVIL
jgi:hypothetical protein